MKNILFRILLSSLFTSATFLFADPPGEGWELVFHDEFNGDQLDWDVWYCEEGDRKSAYSDPKDSYLDGKGHLVFRVRKADDSKYHVGFIRTKEEFQWGYYEARTNLNTVPGYWSAFWLFGKHSYDLDYGGAEVDFMEDPYRNDIVEHNIHQGWPTKHKKESARIRVKGSREDWHLFAGDWHESGFDFYVDDQRTWITRNMTASEPNWIYLTLEVRFGGWAGDIREHDSRLPAYWTVDYVRYYRRNPQAPVIALSHPEPIRLGHEEGKILSVSLQNGTFAEQLNPKSWSVENLPAGVTLETVRRVDGTRVQLKLKGNSQNGSSKAEITDVTVIAETGEVANSKSILIATRGAILSVER